MSVVVESHLDQTAYRRALREDVRAGLTRTPKVLPPKWFYDARGSELFDEITRLPEYYPTRAERSILRAHATEIALTTGADTLVELGSGTSEKTRLLLSALASAGTLRRYVPFDVDPVVLGAAGHAVAEEYVGVDVHGVVGDFERDLAALPGGGRRLVAFLGSTIGNLEPGPRAEFLAAARAQLGPDDALLVGTDLIKDPARLQAAYDDAAGVTSAFNHNVLAVINRELRADFDLDAFEHVARWVPEHNWVEMRLRALIAQTVTVAELDLTIELAEGEQIRTEVSTKFRPDQVEAELAEAGLRRLSWWTDPSGDFGVSLATPA